MELVTQKQWRLNLILNAKECRFENEKTFLQRSVLVRLKAVSFTIKAFAEGTKVNFYDVLTTMDAHYKRKDTFHSFYSVHYGYDVRGTITVVLRTFGDFAIVRPSLTVTPSLTTTIKILFSTLF